MKKPREVLTAFSAYQIGAKLGEGGSGYVYEAKDSAGTQVAIKFLNPVRATEEKRRRFKNEHHFCARNEHMNVIRVIDHGVHDEIPFFVMPHYAGSIRLFIDTLDSAEKLKLFLKILDGVEAAHLKKVIHRDLKPENVLCSSDLSEVVVTDFGIARFDDENELHTQVETRAADRLANYKYRAPEQLEQTGEISQATDIFALGLMLNEMFTGRVPTGVGFQTIGSVDSGFAYLDPIVDKMINQEANLRFASIDELKREIAKQGALEVSRQKLTHLENRVVDVRIPDDPIIADPIRVIDGDWNEQTMTLTLNQVVTSEWLNVFMNETGVQFFSDFDPRRHVTFRGSRATFHCRADQAERFLGVVKQWISEANRRYEVLKTRQIEEEQNRLQDRLEKEKTMERERQEILNKLKF